MCLIIQSLPLFAVLFVQCELLMDVNSCTILYQQLLNGYIVAHNIHYTFLACTPVFRGAFSIVKRAVHKQSGQTFAAKIINTRRLTSRGEQHKAFLFPPSLPLSFSFLLSLFLSPKVLSMSHHHNWQCSTKTIDYHCFRPTPCACRFAETGERSSNLSYNEALQHWWGYT